VVHHVDGAARDVTDVAVIIAHVVTNVVESKHSRRTVRSVRAALTMNVRFTPTPIRTT